MHSLPSQSRKIVFVRRMLLVSASASLGHPSPNVAVPAKSGWAPRCV